jgi:hypothetical protein
MVLRKLVGLLACTLILGSSFAMAGVPDLDESTASLATGGTNLVLYNRLDGTGNGFEFARDNTGAVHSAVVTLYVRDASTAPVVAYPAEDMWLISADAAPGGLSPCPGGNIADFSTDGTGMTEWRAAMGAGGYSEGLCQVVINGDALTSQTGMNLYFNSADIDGNLDVGLPDLTAFTQTYFGAYSIKADFDYNNDIGITDLTAFTSAYFNDAGCQ